MRDYYYMITLTWPTPQGFHTSERRGIVKLRADQSRVHAVEDLLRWIAEQVGAPSEIYNRPATRFVAEFIGSLNLVPGTVRDAAAGAIETPAGVIALGRTLTQPNGSAVSLAIRPEGLHIGQDGNVVLNARVADSEFLGSIIRLRVMAGGNTPLVIARFNREGHTMPEPGQDLTISVNASDIIVLDGVA